MPQFRLQDDEFRPLPPSSGNPVSPVRRCRTAAEMPRMAGVARNTRMPGLPFRARLEHDRRYFCGKLSVWAKRTTTILVRWCITRASARALQPSEKRDLGPETTPSTICRSSSISITQSVRRCQELVVNSHCHAQSQAERRRCPRLASYLITLKHADAQYPAADYLEAPSEGQGQDAG